MGEEKTLYEWCVLNRMRPLDIGDDVADSFMLEKISLELFKGYIANGEYIKESFPLKPEKYLELRMYGFVPYNISDIQKGIQFGHAVDQYIKTHWDEKETQWWLDEWKTYVILNGGTSNEGTAIDYGFKQTLYSGGLQGLYSDLRFNGIKHEAFYEPDLNSMLSAFVFLVDERVFNKELYPDFMPLESLGPDASQNELLNWFKSNEEKRQEWVKTIGGPKNEFLRDFLAGKRLA